jgi:serine/threonine protein kinase
MLVSFTQSYAKAFTPNFRSQFTDLVLVGQGMFSEVYRGTSVTDGKVYAIKRSKTPFNTNKKRALLLKEIDLLARIGLHPHIVDVQQCWQEQGHFFVQTELCAGTLSDRSLREEKVSVAFLLDTLEQIGEALKQMHGLGILHCDIKPENVLVALNPGPQPTSSNDGPGVLKIGDFGQSCSVSEGPQIKDGTEGDCSYMAPELLNDKAEHTGAVDVFSTGLLLFEVASRQQLPQMGPVWHAFRNGPHSFFVVFL